MELRFISLIHGGGERPLRSVAADGCCSSERSLGTTCSRSQVLAAVRGGTRRFKLQEPSGLEASTWLIRVLLSNHVCQNLYRDSIDPQAGKNRIYS